MTLTASTRSAEIQIRKNNPNSEKGMWIKSPTPQAVDSWWERENWFPTWSDPEYINFTPGQAPCPGIVG